MYSQYGLSVYLVQPVVAQATDLYRVCTVAPGLLHVHVLYSVVPWYYWGHVAPVVGEGTMVTV